MKTILDRCSIFHTTSQNIYYMKYDKRKLKKYIKKNIAPPFFDGKYKNIIIGRCDVLPPYKTKYINNFLIRNIDYLIPMSNRQFNNEPIFLKTYFKIDKKQFSTFIHCSQKYISVYKEKP